MSDSSQKPRVAVLDDYQNAARSFADWSRLSSQIDLVVFSDALHDHDALVARLAPFDVICSMRERTKFPEVLLSKLGVTNGGNLKLLCTTGMRNAAIDLKAAKSAGVTVCGTGSGGNSTTEQTWALILALARNVVSEHNATVEGRDAWQSTVGITLQGKTLGLLGLGKLGVSVGRIGQAFGMEILAWSPHLTRERVSEAIPGAQLASSLDDLFAKSDILSIHMVLAPLTTHLIRYEHLSKMKPTAYLVNTSRGPIVKESDLIRALEERKLKGAGLDVFDEEPLTGNSVLRTRAADLGLVISPHIGYVSDEAYKVFFRETVENVEAFLCDTPLRVLNP